MGGFVVIPYVSVLVVADGFFSFRPADPLDNSFTLHFLIETLRSTTPGVGFRVTTAYRGNDAFADLPNFNFAQHDLGQFDEIWMFGYDGANFGAANNLNDTISDAELAAITTFMQNGGGVMAAGDHDGLGSVMCGKIPRVRSMRRWYSETNTPAGHLPNAPGLGAGRIDTTRADHSGQFWFDNQSDDIPQVLTVVEAHPVLQSGGGLLTKFPDHMHEGAVEVPASLTGTGSFAGVNFVEYPVLAGHQEAPRIIATGVTIGGHPTPIEPGAGGGFTGAADPEQGQTFNAICVYDGSKVKVGRVLTQSSFHHFMDLNLIGDPQGVGSKTLGFKTLAGASVLEGMRQYIRNVGYWLAEHQHYYLRLIEYVIQLPWWVKLFDPGGPVETNPGPILEYGLLMRQALARYANDDLTSNFVRSLLADVRLGELLPQDPWRGAGVQGGKGERSTALRSRVIEAALGGIAMAMMEAQAGESRQAGDASRQARDRSRAGEIARRGVTAGLRGLGHLLRTEAEAEIRLSQRLLAEEI